MSHYESHCCTGPEGAKSYRMAGKLGPWARRGAEGVRYFAVGVWPVYRRILSAVKEDSWDYVRVRLEGEAGDERSCWCGTNTYEEVNQDGDL